MKKKNKEYPILSKVFTLAITLVLALLFASPASAQTKPTLTYRAYVQSHGWMSFRAEGQTAGTTGESRRMEALNLRITGGARVRARAHVQGHGWMSIAEGTDITVGTTGQSRRMEALTLELVNSPYGIEYRVHVQGHGWIPWQRNGGTAGTTGESRRIEAVEARIIDNPSPSLSITGTSTNRTTGTTNDSFDFHANTNIPASRAELRFSGNNTVFQMRSSNSGRTWSLTGQKLPAGDRTITMTVIASDGTSPVPGTINVTVTPIVNTAFSPVWPTDGGRITAGDRYPSSGNLHSKRYARAIDIGVGVGTNVYATEEGTVTEVRDVGNTSFGKFIVIRHDNGAFSLYAHLSSQNVRVKDRVSRSQFIGKSGNSGGVSPHLHFELSNSTRDRMADFFPGR